MRINMWGTGRPTLVAGATLLGAALALAPTAAAAGATPGTDQSLTAKGIDASVSVSGRHTGQAGWVTGLDFTARSNAPVASYRLTVRMPRGATFWEYDAIRTWHCSNTSRTVSCAYVGTATRVPTPIMIAFLFPREPGKFTFRASLSTAEHDTNTRNNSASWTVVTKRKPPAPSHLGTVAGRVWNDANHNGRQDKGEKGVAGATVLAVNSEVNPEAPVARATTGRDGRYVMRNVQPNHPDESVYGIVVIAPGQKWRFTKANVGAERGDSDLRPIERGSYRRFVPKGAVAGSAESVNIGVGTTTVIDAGLIRRAAADGGPSLPVTGPAAQGLAAGGAGLLSAGGALLFLARRRRPALS